MQYVEKKAKSEVKPQHHRWVNEQWANLNIRIGAFATAREYLQKLLDAASKDEKDMILARMLQLDLQTGHVNRAVEILQSALNAGDIDEQHEMAQVINVFVAQIYEDQARLTLIREVFSKIRFKDPRPNWQRLTERWLSAKTPDGSITMSQDIPDGNG